MDAHLTKQITQKCVQMSVLKDQYSKSNFFLILVLVISRSCKHNC